MGFARRQRTQGAESAQPTVIATSAAADTREQTTQQATNQGANTQTATAQNGSTQAATTASGRENTQVDNSTSTPPTPPTPTQQQEPPGNTPLSSGCTLQWDVQGASFTVCPPTTTETPQETFQETTSTTSSSFEASQASATSSPASTGKAAKLAKSGVSGGAVAGAAIGCFIAGALIAAAVFFFLLRRQKKKQSAIHHQQHLPYNGLAPGPEKDAIVATSQAPGGGVASNVDNLLPQPVEDAAITKELSKIRDNIKNHVRSYYHFDGVSATAINDSKLKGVATATGLGSSALANLLLNPATRSEAIRLFIGWVALSRCTGDRYPTFLPDELARIAVIIPGKDGQNAAQSALFSKWKTITGALLQQRQGKQIHDANLQEQSVVEAIAEIDSVLAPFVQDSIDGGQRRRNLDMIMSRAAQFSFLLFSQPGSFRFDFTGQQIGVVVFPALLQIVGDRAQLLSPPRVLWDKELATETGVPDPPDWVQR